MNLRKFLVIFGLIFVGAVVYYFASTDRSQDLVLIGTVDANQVVVSAKIAGRIEKLLVDEGTRVKEGDLIAVLDSAELEAQKRAAESTLASLRSQVSGTKATELMTKGSTSSDVLTARARVQSTRAQLQAAQADLERQQIDTKRTVELAEEGIAAQQDRDHALAALKSSQAQVRSLQDQVRAAESDLASTEARIHNAAAAQSTVAATRAQMLSAQAQLVETEARLDYTQVYAPISGVVSLRAALQGEVVNPGTPIVTIMDLNETWVRADVPETYADKVNLGDTLQVRMPGGSLVPGKLIFKNTEGDFATQRDVSRRKRDIKTVALKFLIPNQDMRYATGMTAEVLVPASRLNPAGRAPVAAEQGK